MVDPHEGPVDADLFCPWASSMVCSSESAALRARDPGTSRQKPKERNPIFLFCTPAAWPVSPDTVSDLPSGILLLPIKSGPLS